ncbi:MAG: hypothetical protein IH845_02325 [Nanoarchaeota archaeon]|nr:hypothetical protein [Nanoarchaeota archaeon]
MIFAIQNVFKWTFSSFARTAIVRVGNSARILYYDIFKDNVREINMSRGKKVREKGKIRLSRYFKNIEDGARVAIVTDLGVKASFPKRLKGYSGKVTGSRGKYKLVELKDGNKTKMFIIHPAHLRKL